MFLHNIFLKSPLHYLQEGEHTMFLQKPLLRSLLAPKRWCYQCYLESGTCFLGTPFPATPNPRIAQDNPLHYGKATAAVRKLFSRALQHFFSIKPVKFCSLYSSLSQEWEPEGVECKKCSGLAKKVDTFKHAV